MPNIDRLILSTREEVTRAGSSSLLIILLLEMEVWLRLVAQSEFLREVVEAGVRKRSMLECTELQSEVRSTHIPARFFYWAEIG